jgi:hypothetical protein
MLMVDFTTKECTLKNHVSGCPVLAPGTVQDAYVQSLWWRLCMYMDWTE